MNSVTQLLESFDRSDALGSEELLSQLYDDLRRIAGDRMRYEGPNHTLQPTALVHEAWIRLTESRSQQWESRSQFLRAAAEIMRRVLVDHARRKRRLKRGAGAERVELDESKLPMDQPAEVVLGIHEALDLLAIKNPVCAELVKLRYFVGLPMDEVADALNLSKRTAEGMWTYARVWMQQRMQSER